MYIWIKIKQFFKFGNNRWTSSELFKIILLGYLFGVVLASFVFSFTGEVDLKILAIIGIVGFFSILFYLRKFQKIFLVMLLLLFVIFSLAGVYRYRLTFPKENSVAGQVDGSHRVEGIVEKIDIRGNNKRVFLRKVNIDGKIKQNSVLVYISSFSKVSYGDKISFRCDLEAPQPFDGFRYDRFLASKDIYATCFLYGTPLILSGGNGGAVKTVLMKWRSSVIQHTDKIFGDPQSSLLLGLLIGEVRFSTEWQDYFLKTGTSHVVAASGYNVTVVSYLAMLFLISVGFRRQKAFGFLVGAIFGYVILAGAEAAVVRAGVMGIVVLLSSQLGRRSSMFNVILLTMTIMLLINPRLFRDDVGFQLSLLSTVGLVYLTPVFERYLKFIPEDYSLREAFTSTLAATFITLPIIIFGFGTVSLVNPIVNLLILPVIPFAMFFGAVAILVSYFSVVVAGYIAGPAWALLSFVLTVIKSVAKIPGVNIVVDERMLWYVGFLSVIILSILWLKLQRNMEKH